MNIFVAGGSGAIGRPLIAELVRRGHAVTGMTPSDAGAKILADLGAAVAKVDAFNADDLEKALRKSKSGSRYRRTYVTAEQSIKDGRSRSKGSQTQARRGR